MTRAEGIPDFRGRSGRGLVDLSGLYDKNMLNVLLDRMLGGDRGPMSHPENGWWLNLVRLTDKAVREHEMAATEFQQFRSGGSNHFSPFVRAVDALENCVVSTHRAGLHAKQLIAGKHAPRSLRPTPGQLDRLRLVRNHLEHSDDKLLKGQIKAGEPFTLRPLENRLEIGKVRLSYRDLAAVITKCYRVVEAVRGPSGSRRT